MTIHLRENEVSREDQVHDWHEADTTLGLSSLLRALQRPREISTNYGLNDTIQDMKMGQPDVQDYEIALTEDGEVAPGPHWRHLFRWLVAGILSAPQWTRSQG